MKTTTEDRGLVRRLEKPAPLPGHDVLVFDPVGSGRRHRVTLGPDEVFRPPLAERVLHRDRTPIAYAVSRDPQQHSFSRSMPTIKDIALPVHVTLDVSVADPQWVVERLDKDPLKRFEDEVAKRCAKVVKGLEPKALYGQNIDPDRLVLDHLLEDDQGCLATCGDILARFAPTQGLILHRISLTWSHPEAWQIHTQEVVRLELGHDLRELKENHANEEAVQRRAREDFEHGARLGREIRSSLAEKVKDTIVNRPSSSLTSIAHDIGTLDRKLNLLKHPDSPALPENGSRPAALDGDGLPGVLSCLLDLADDECYEAPVRRRLLADGLRAIAAAVEGGDRVNDQVAEDGAAGNPGESIRQLLADLVRENALASNDHRQLLHRLGDPEALRVLGWEGLDDDA